MLLVRLLIALCLVAIVGCERPDTDARFETPEATVSTMMTLYGVDAMSEKQVQAHMKAKQQFHLQDREQYLECFADFDKPSDEGLTGFVFGRLAAAKDSLVYKTTAETSVIHTSANEGAHKIVLKKQKSGNWKVVLNKSVPLKTKKQLHAVYKRAQKQFRPL